MNIGKQLKFYREQMELSQKELAELIFVSDRSVGHYETGVRIPPVDKLELIANVLQVDISDLLEPTRKTKSDWFKFMIHHYNQKKRTQMDVNKFHLFLKRTNEYRKVEETKEWIKSENVYYHKQLGEFLTTLSNKYITFTASLYDVQKCWYIFGYIGNNPFTIELLERDNDVLVHSSAPFYEYTYLSSEFKVIINTILKWFKQTFPHYTFKYDVETLVYLDHNDKNYILNLELDGFEFSKEYEIFHQFKRIKEKNLNTLQKILDAQKEKDPSLKTFFTLAGELLSKVKAWINDTKLHSITSLPSLSELKTMYSNSREFPLHLLDEDNTVMWPFIHRGHKTLGDIADFTKEEALMIYGTYGIFYEKNLYHAVRIEIVDQLEHTLAFYDLTFRVEN